MAQQSEESIAYLSLGANLGDRRENLRRAVHLLAVHPACRIDQRRGVASLYASRPAGSDERQPDYFNSAVRVETTLPPRLMLTVMMSLEAGLGRVRRERWGPRTIDIDLLLYDHQVIEDIDLIVPHPRMEERRFVLEPLTEIAADVVHPVIGTRIGDLRRRHAAVRDDQETVVVEGPGWAAEAFRPTRADSP
jgi:2-amino-4-hydroxy-6-hydroxymethyldihydropteridine diphosphokinase